MYRKIIAYILLFTCTVYLNACYCYKPAGEKERVKKDEMIMVKLKSGGEEELIYKGYLYNKQFCSLISEDGITKICPFESIKEIRLTPPTIIDKESLKSNILIDEIILNNNLCLKADSGYTYLEKYNYIRLFDSRCINLDNIKEVRGSAGVNYSFNPMETGIEKKAFEVFSSKSVITKIKSFKAVEIPMSLYGSDKNSETVYIPVDEISQIRIRKISPESILLLACVSVAVIYYIFWKIRTTPINLGLRGN